MSFDRSASRLLVNGGPFPSPGCVIETDVVTTNSLRVAPASRRKHKGPERALRAFRRAQPVRSIVTISATGEPATPRKCAASTREGPPGQGRGPVRGPIPYSELLPFDGRPSSGQRTRKNGIGRRRVACGLTSCADMHGELHLLADLFGVRLQSTLRRRGQRYSAISTTRRRLGQDDTIGQAAPLQNYAFQRDGSVLRRGRETATDDPRTVRQDSRRLRARACGTSGDQSDAQCGSQNRYKEQPHVESAPRARY